jgi:hypothetical protein
MYVYIFCNNNFCDHMMWSDGESFGYHCGKKCEASNLIMDMT